MVTSPDIYDSYNEISEIRRLRNENDLEHAYTLGKELLAQNPDDLSVKRDFAWVCLDQAKDILSRGYAPEAMTKVREIKALNFPSNDILHKQLHWTLRNILKQYCLKEKDADMRKEMAIDLFEFAKNIPANTPDQGYSAFIHELHKCLKDYPRDYAYVISSIGLSFFGKEDYEEFANDNESKKKASRAEIIFATYSKSLISIIVSPKDENEHNFAVSTANAFSKLAVTVMEQHKYSQLAPLISKLLIVLGRTTEAKDIIIKEIKRKRNEAKLWYLLSETMENDYGKLSAICVSLSVPSNDELKVHLMESAATVMAKLGYYAEAKREILNADAIKLSKWGKIHINSVSNLIKQDSWWEHTEPTENNRKFYCQHFELAEEAVYSKDTVSVVITYSNSEKKFLNFITENDKKGFFNYSNFLSKPPLQGEIYDIVFEHFSESEPSRVRWMRLNSDPSDDCKLFRFAEGKVRIDPKNNFGFVDNIYIPTDFVSKYDIHNGDYVRVKSVRTFDNIKKSLSWRVTQLTILYRE